MGNIISGSVVAGMVFGEEVCRDEQEHGRQCALKDGMVEFDPVQQVDQVVYEGRTG